MKAKYKIGDKVWNKNFVGISKGEIIEIHEETEGYAIQNCENKRRIMNCGYEDVICKTANNEDIEENIFKIAEETGVSLEFVALSYVYCAKKGIELTKDNVEQVVREIKVKGEI